VNVKYDSVPKAIDVTSKGKIIIQCDATKWRGLIRPMWVGILYISSRDTKGAQGLWDSLPSVYRQCAVSFIDFWKAYDTIFPKS